MDFAYYLLVISLCRPSQFDADLCRIDGGDVRGLSSLYILQGLVRKINAERGKGFPALKACDVSDLIGGTSRMSIQSCLCDHC